MFCEERLRAHGLPSQEERRLRRLCLGRVRLGTRKYFLPGRVGFLGGGWCPMAISGHKPCG